MIFLNPFVLLGLAAAAISVLLHLLDLHMLRMIEFRSVGFVMEPQKTSTRGLRSGRYSCSSFIHFSSLLPSGGAELRSTAGDNSNQSRVLRLCPFRRFDETSDRLAFFETILSVLGGEKGVIQRYRFSIDIPR